ncbi:MAG: epimerase [bacterium]
MTIKPIIFGASGMVGEGVLHVALQHPKVESVLVVGRRTCDRKHEKLKEVLHQDFFNYTMIEENLKGYNACFFCLGVTSIGKNEEEYTRLTYDLTMQAASTLSRLNPGMTFCYVSGTGTDSSEHGRSMWARVKGRTENHLTTLSFRAIYLFRPGFINPVKGLKRAHSFAAVLSVFYPVWKILFSKYVCTLEDLGAAMIHSVMLGYPNRILENRDIKRLAQTNPGNL